MTNPRMRWYEPQHSLLGSKSYFAHTWGSAYALSGAAADLIARLPPEQLRYFSNEGAAVKQETYTFDQVLMCMLKRCPQQAVTMWACCRSCCCYADVTVGSWMLAFNVSHFDDRRMCAPECEPNAVAVYDFPK